MVWIQQKQKILRRGGKNTQNCTKTIFMTQIIMMLITHLEPDILECEVKWALGSITTLMEFQLGYFKSYKMML